MASPTAWVEQNSRFTDLKARGIPVADAPMIYHLWAAFEKVDHCIGDLDYKLRIRGDILNILDWATRDG